MRIQLNCYHPQELEQYLLGRTSRKSCEVVDKECDGNKEELQSEKERTGTGKDIKILMK